jgi:hypothetical protein
MEYDPEQWTWDEYKEMHDAADNRNETDVTVRYFEESIIDCPLFNKFVRSDKTCKVCDFLAGEERDRIYCLWEPDSNEVIE